MKKLHILSRSREPFADRREAGELLGLELAGYRGKNAVVLGIPRGGIVIAREIADALEADLDIVFARKLGAPGNPELAVGSVGEDGRVFLNKGLIQQFAIPPSDLAQEREAQWALIKQRSLAFRKVRPKIPLAGRIVILTDDGVATGATMRAALWSARQEHPAKLIAALPVGPEGTLRQLSENADEVFCLCVPPYLGAVGQFYLNFAQVEDREVLEILKQSANRSHSHA